MCPRSGATEAEFPGTAQKRQDRKASIAPCRGDSASPEPASPGSYTGSVRVVRDETEFTKLQSGDVLVCPVTSPSWSLLFQHAGAVVTDGG